MIRSLLTRSPEIFAIGNAAIGVLVAALLTRFPKVSFGTFWQMAMTLIIADLVVYVGMKLGWLKMPRPRH